MIDLHIHTTYSDGTDNVEKVVNTIIEKGITHFSITDHDMIAGSQELLNNNALCDLLKKFGVKFITGVEFSGIIDDDKIHILAYNYDIENEEISKVVSIGKARRYTKFQKRLDALEKQKGIYFSEQSIKDMRALSYVGNPIMSHYLIKDGIFKDKNLAMRCINSLDIPKTEINIEVEIIMPAILNSGGIAVWAHPLGGLNEQRITFEKVEEIIQKLLPIGLRGLECYYNLYTFEEVEKLVELANKYNLLVSVGSDYHGKNKDAMIGEVVNKQNFDATKFATILNEF